jgi:hypothetical protein
MKSCSILCFVGATYGAGLVDNPIVADSIQYLDGDWTAVSSGGPSTACEFIPNVDWDNSGSRNTGTEVDATSKVNQRVLKPICVTTPRPPLLQEDCCGKCLEDSTCVVAVLAGSTCWKKTAADSTQKVAKTGVISCKKKPALSAGRDAGHSITGRVRSYLFNSAEECFYPQILKLNHCRKSTRRFAY